MYLWHGLSHNDTIRNHPKIRKEELSKSQCVEPRPPELEEHEVLVVGLVAREPRAHECADAVV